MVIALFALSLAMIVGGIAAVVQGFPYVRLESGLAMVIGGTTAASAGVVLLGLGAAVMQLKRMEGMLGRRSAVPDALAGLVPPDPDFRAPAVEALPPVSTMPQTSHAGAAGLAGVTLGTIAPTRLDGGGAVEREPLLPDLLPPVEAVDALGDEDLFARPEDRPSSLAVRPHLDPIAGRDAPAESIGDAPETLALRPALEEPAAPPAEDTPAPDEAATGTGRQAVGSYASGGNTYVMFSDGTIDAETPRGRFTFQSLDELKAFVASGEAGERGAA